MNHQDSGTIIISFLLLLPSLGRAADRLSRYGENTSKRNAGKQNTTTEAKSPRKLARLYA